MMASTQITNTEIYAFIFVVDLKLLSIKVMLTNRKGQQKLLKSRLLFKKIANSWVNYCKILNSWNGKF